MNRHPYPPEFIAALLDTAERATSTDPRWHYIRARIALLIEQPSTPKTTTELKALVPQLCWLIQEAGGWFYGPGSSY